MKLKKPTDVPHQIHNLLMSSKTYKPLYMYLKDGIYLMYGPLKGTNLSKEYEKDSDAVIDYLHNVIDYEYTPYKTKWQTIEVINDLINKNYVTTNEKEKQL